MIARPGDDGETPASRSAEAHLERVSYNRAMIEHWHRRGLLARGDGPLDVAPGRGATDGEIA